VLVRDQCGMRDSASSPAEAKSLQIETGATGLEPATSGDRLVPPIRPLATIDALSGLFMKPAGLRCLFLHDCVGSISEVCCPSAARTRHSEPRGWDYRVGGDLG
jgi:hypothetical protein